MVSGDFATQNLSGQSSAVAAGLEGVEPAFKVLADEVVCQLNESFQIGRRHVETTQGMNKLLRRVLVTTFGVHGGH
ncbi:MAG: hypothetical protein WAK55_22040 [Xanthobacteraceae bacterium]